MRLTFQSSPTSQGGRYAWTLNVSIMDFNVSILAHLARWALRLRVPPSRSAVRFQSSPTSQGGRYGRHGKSSALASSFNPRPPRKVGATPDSVRVDQLLKSFNPRPPRKVGATVDRAPRALALTRFNPRPPRKVGATRPRRHSAYQGSVSILAHLARWALQPSCKAFPTHAMFQSSPTSQGGRYSDRRAD